MEAIMSEEIINKTEEKDAPVEIVGINFREAGKVYYFSPEKFKFNRGDKVIVETSRGLEMGTVKLPNKTVKASEVVSPLKPVTRPATKADVEKDEQNRKAEAEAAEIIIITTLNLKRWTANISSTDCIRIWTKRSLNPSLTFAG